MSLTILSILLYHLNVSDAKMMYGTGEISAYTASIEETDSNPCETASGLNGCEFIKQGIGVIGNNCLPFGTILKIGDYKGVVLDRMADRYGCNNYDLMFTNKKDALQFGRRNLTVYKYNLLK